jgi:hypothetical protein
MNLRPFDHNSIGFQFPEPNRPPQQKQIYSSQRPVSSIPFSQSQQMPQQQVLTVPSQSYRVVNPVDQRHLISYGPSA